MTVAGPEKGKPCIFPFWHGGVTYNECTWDFDTQSENMAGCATQVNTDGKFVEGKWGYCGPDCPIEPDNRKWCVTEGGEQCFPFRDWERGKRIYECSWADAQWRNNSAWCKTSKWAMQWQWGTCRQECPISSKVSYFVK